MKDKAKGLGPAAEELDNSELVWSLINLAKDGSPSASYGIEALLMAVRGVIALTAQYGGVTEQTVMDWTREKFAEIMSTAATVIATDKKTHQGVYVDPDVEDKGPLQ